MVSPTYSARQPEWMNEVGKELTAMRQSTNGEQDGMRAWRVERA